MKLNHLAACAIIGVVTVTAILHGLDGQVAYAGIVAIAGIAGYSLNKETKN